jgi:Flp pilus assembly protein TadB
MRNILKSTGADKKKTKKKTPRRLPKLDKKALKRSLWGSLSRVIGVGLGVGASSIVHQLLGDSLSTWGTAAAMAVASFVFIWFAEYEREIN